MLNVKSTVEQMQAEGTIIEEVSPMEALSLRIMTLLSRHKALFKLVMDNNPEQAYEKAGQALTLFISFDSVEQHHAEAAKLLEEYRRIQQEAGEESVNQNDLRKAEMSNYLWSAGNFLVEIGAFSVDTASILGLFAARMAAHTVKESKWAGKEIKKSFIKRFF